MRNWKAKIKYCLFANTYMQTQITPPIHWPSFSSTLIPDIKQDITTFCCWQVKTIQDNQWTKPLDQYVLSIDQLNEEIRKAMITIGDIRDRFYVPPCDSVTDLQARVWI